MRSGGDRVKELRQKRPVSAMREEGDGSMQGHCKNRESNTKEHVEMDNDMGTEV